MFIESPKKAAEIERTKESKIYIKENETLPSLNNSIVSIENAEKVVNDPQRPIITKYLKNNSETSLLFR